MSKITLIPDFDSINNAAVFPSKELNYLAANTVVDYSEFYQSVFGVYNFMKLRNRTKFKIWFPKSFPFKWQQHNSCSWDPLGGVSWGNREVSPCNAKINESWCYDDSFGSCFDHLHTWDAAGRIGMSATGQQMLAMTIRQIIMDAVEGAKLVVTAGQMYDYDKLKASDLFADGTSKTIKTAFEKTLGTCQGWVELVKQRATMAGKGHLNIPNLFDTDNDFDGEDFIRDVHALADDVYKNARPALKRIVNRGGVNVAGQGAIVPIWLADPTIYSAFAKREREDCLNPLCKNPRLTKRQIQWNGGTYDVLYLDGKPIIPIDELGCYDEYLNGRTRLFALTVSRNINLGFSFDDIPEINKPGFALRIQESQRNEDLGKYSVLSHALFASAIGHDELYAGGQLFTTI